MSTQTTPRDIFDVLVRAGLAAVLAVFCYRVFLPFLDLMLWATILAITLYPMYRGFVARIGGRRGWGATAMVIGGILVMIVPIYLISVSAFESIHGLIDSAKHGEIHIPPPEAKVADIPVIGKPLHDAWAGAATDLTAMLKPLAPEIKATSLTVLGKLAGLGVAVLLFMAALIVAGIIMVFGEQGHLAANRISSKIFGADRGPDVAKLCTATVRTVAQGVVGIAFIQMLLVAAGLIVKGVPGAGLLSIIVLVLGIAQVPATLVTIPVIALVLYKEGANAGTIAFSIYTFIAGLADNVLKPILLGRGVDVPMPVILIGALGGMVTGGIIGLFIGPVALAVGYRLFWQWVDASTMQRVLDAEEEEAAEKAAAVADAGAKT